jgi:hypothetical protein
MLCEDDNVSLIDGDAVCVGDDVAVGLVDWDSVRDSDSVGEAESLVLMLLESVGVDECEGDSVPDIDAVVVSEVLPLEVWLDVDVIDVLPEPEAEKVVVRDADIVADAVAVILTLCVCESLVDKEDDIVAEVLADCVMELDADSERVPDEVSDSEPVGLELCVGVSD